jgi:hypothetical protein
MAKNDKQTSHQMSNIKFKLFYSQSEWDQAAGLAYFSPLPK